MQEKTLTSQKQTLKGKPFSIEPKNIKKMLFLAFRVFVFVFVIYLFTILDSVIKLSMSPYGGIMVDNLFLLMIFIFLIPLIKLLHDTWYRKVSA